MKDEYDEYDEKYNSSGKLNHGVFFRTHKGEFGRISYYNDDRECYIYYEKNDWYPLYESQIKKSSLDLVDIIEKNDIVINYDNEIFKVDKVWKGYVFTDKHNEYGQVITLVDYQIKSIVSKEELERMEFITKEELI